MQSFRRMRRELSILRNDPGKVRPQDYQCNGERHEQSGPENRAARLSIRGGGDESEPPMMWNANYSGDMYGFTTYEKVEEPTLHVVKKDGSRVPFDRGRIMAGLLKACEKRPVSMDRLEETVNRIESELNETFDKEVSARFIGQLVMKELRELDHVAYVRFASVYREFKDVNEFLDELKPLLEGRRETHDP